MPPVAVRSAPAERKNAVKEFLDFRGGAIAQRRQVGDQSSVPEQHRNGEVGRDRKDVPEQRAAEVWPDAVIVRQRRQIPRHPNAADVHARENRGANHREKCHRFRGTIDRGAPFLSQQVKNRRNQSAGVSDTDPEHEVGNVPGPADGMVQSPGADAGGNLIAETEKTETGNSRGDGEGDPPPARRAIFHRAGDALRNPAVTPPVQYQRRREPADARAKRSPRSQSVLVLWWRRPYSFVIPSAAEGSRCKSFKVSPRDSSTPLRCAQNDTHSFASSFSLGLAIANFVRIRHFRIRIANAREVTDARIHVQILKQAIIAVLQFHFRNLALRIANVSENDGLVRAGLRARRGEGIARNSKVIRGSARADVSGDFRFLDPLHTKGAFLHHPAHAHGHVRIFRQLDRIGRAFFGERREVFLIDVERARDFLFADRPLVVIEEIETPNLERAIVRAITRADAAVVGHDVQAVFAVDGSVDRANRFARRVLAVLTHHRFMHHLGIFRKLALVLVVAMSHSRNSDRSASSASPGHGRPAVCQRPGHCSPPGRR